VARQFIYHMAGLNKSYGAKKILENIHLSFYPDAKIGILGPNGAGKSTVLRIMAGLDSEFTGEAWLAEGATLGYLPQEPQLDESLNVLGNVMEGVAEKQAILDRYNELMMNYSDETADEGAKLQDIIDSQNLWDLDSQVEMAMEALALPAGEAVDALSGGEKRRVALCALLLRQPDLILLDEPTNHLDAESIAWLEKHLREYPGAVIMITHDRYFLDNVTGWILELDRGRGIPYEGNYTAYLDAKAKRMKQEGREEASRQKSLAREQEWIASAPKARQAKSKARIRAYDELVKAAGDRRPGEAQIVIPTGERLGNQVIDAEGISKGLWRPAADRRSDVQAAARRHCRRHRPERRRQDDAVPDDHRAGTARQRARSPSARRCIWPMSTRAAIRSMATRPSGRKSPAATTSSSSASTR
jgi:ATPase subunit of ABC transporter with duplicated ATPase domains